MPGFNQRGPMNEGAMTGRGRGNCTSTVDPAQGFEGRGSAMGMGRQCGRRGGQGPGFRRDPGQWTTAAPTAASVTNETLRNSVDMLEAELVAVKQQLKDLTGSRE